MQLDFAENLQGCTLKHPIINNVLTIEERAEIYIFILFSLPVNCLLQELFYGWSQECMIAEEAFFFN
jgi:hypothetical protein